MAGKYGSTLGGQQYGRAVAAGGGTFEVRKPPVENIANYENELLQYATKKLLQIEDLKIYGT